MESTVTDETEAAALRCRRDAAAQLGRALHDLVQTAVATEAATDDLYAVVAQVRAASATLAGRVRGRERLPSTDDLPRGIRMFNPVTGLANPLAPPLRISVVDGAIVGACTLGLAFEGPPMYAHGGISALLLDQMLGYAIASTRRPAMTRDLVMRYRRPVPLATPLHLTAAITGEEGRSILAVGTIATAEDPSEVLVEATGTFRALRPDQARALFSAALRPGGSAR